MVFLGEAKSSLCKLQFEGLHENGETNCASVANKELEASAPLSLITSSSSEEDAVNGDTSGWSSFPGYLDFSIPRRPPIRIEDPYISLLNTSPRKEVFIGPDHQAAVPFWDPNATRKYLVNSEREDKLTGTCIIPMPDLNDSTMEGIRVGRGRTDCSCLDVGSMRCVQQHVTEARERLRETIGDENFVELGFSNMGDEVACRWVPDDEHIFREVVFSNPASHGRNFWKHLSAAFPTRTKKELVSYYFNVFMLRKRAVQNRSYLLEIDSDDDEEQRGVHGELYQNGSHPLDQDTDVDDDHHRGPNGECYLVGEEEDSTVESFDDQDLDSSWVDDFWSEPQSVVCGDQVSNTNHGNSASKVEKKQEPMEMNGITEMISGKDGVKLYDDPRFFS